MRLPMGPLRMRERYLDQLRDQKLEAMGLNAPSRSSFTWLDYSEHERRKMMDVIHAFDEKGTRDELGIGTIRNGLADLLFPGTGTVQTRARYFLFIPWIYLELEGSETPSQEIARKARNREVELIEALIKGGEQSGGIIGIDARADLQRLPSNIYWQGLGVLGIRRYAGSQDQYHRSLDGWHVSKRERPPTDRGENYDDGMLRLNWHPAIPLPSKGWRWDATFRLTKEEARFLRDTIMNRCPASLLAHLVTLDRQLGESDFGWNSDQYASFPARNQYELAHARNFSEVMHGAALLYNLLLARKACKDNLARDYLEAIREWSRMVRNRETELSNWDIASFWSLLEQHHARVSSRTVRFVDEWIRRVLNARDPAKLADDKQVQQLIRNREIDLKHGLARLENVRALELWNEAAGTGRLDFRWGIARQMANDILEGLGHA